MLRYHDCMQPRSGYQREQRDTHLHRVLLALTCQFVFAAATANAAPAPAYPSKPIRMLVGFSPGGASDVIARIIGQKLAETLSQQIIVDNRSGGGGLVASELTAKANPDGYTLLSASSSLVIQPSITKDMPFDTVRDLAPITLAVTAPYMLIVNASFAPKSVKELIDLAKAQPGKLSYASAGAGSGLTLSGELFKSMAGVDIVEIPYKGAVGITDVLAGQVPMAFSGLPQGMPHVRSGRLRALGVTGTARSPIAPDIPTIAEAGVPGYEVTVLYGFLAPGRTPKAIIDKLHAEIVKALQLPDTRQSLLNLGLEPVGSTPEYYAATIRREIGKWAQVIKRAGIRAN